MQAKLLIVIFALVEAWKQPKCSVIGEGYIEHDTSYKLSEMYFMAN